MAKPTKNRTNGKTMWPLNHLEVKHREDSFFSAQESHWNIYFLEEEKKKLLDKVNELRHNIDLEKTSITKLFGKPPKNWKPKKINDIL